MDQIIKQIAAATGIDAQAVRRATGVIMNFLSREGPTEAIINLFDALPGSRDLAAKTDSSGGGLMGIFSDLTGAGLGMSDIQGFVSELLAQVRAKAGAEKVNAVMAGIPDLAAVHVTTAGPHMEIWP